MVDISNIFGMYLRELRDFADGNIITHITQLSIQHIGVAPQVADILTFALADQRTPPTYKKPLFYVIDSILKRAGGPYNYLFQQRLAAAFPAMIGNVPDEDRRKISTMLGTWRERNFFSEEFLNNLQGQLMSIRIPLMPAMEPTFPYSNPANQFHNATMNFAPTIPASTAISNVGPTSVPAAKSEYENMVFTRMTQIMQEIFAGLDPSKAISLEELKSLNPDLFQQIRLQAETDAKTLWQQKINIPNESVTQSRFGPPVSTKRSIDEAFSSAAVSNDLTSQKSRQPRTNPGVNSSSSPSEPELPPGIVKGFVSDKPVIIDLTRVKALAESLATMTQQAYAPKVPTKVLESVANRISQRLDFYANHALEPPVLPDVLTDNSAFSFLESIQTNSSTTGGQTTSAPTRPPMPEFRLADFTRNPEIKVRGTNALYSGEFFRENGLRFKTVAELSVYTDAHIEKKKLLQKKKELKERVCREWNSTLDQWVTNFGELKPLSSSVANGSTGTAQGGNTSNVAEEFIVPADEHFARCPISHEVFQKDWDYEAGENIFHNAVRVLITNAGDPSILAVAEPVYAFTDNGATVVDGIKYLIVHKPLVMDRWLAEGKAKTLLEVLQHLKDQQHSSFAVDLVDKLVLAAGEDDEEDLFVILDDSMR